MTASMTAQRANKLLGIALLVQLVLVAIAWWPRGEEDVLHPLLTLDRDALSAVTVTGPPRKGSDEPPKQVRLVKEGGSWKIESAAGYPAQAGKVNELLDKLFNIKVRHPIATSAAHHKDLHVAEEDYGKKVTLETGERSLTLYLGSASSNAVHVRIDGQDEVYDARGFSVWSIGDSNRRYWDPVYLSTDISRIRSFRIELPGGAIQLDKEDGKWSSPDLEEGQVLDQAEVAKLVKDLATLRLSEPVGTEAQPDYGLENGIHVGWVADPEEEGGEPEELGYRVGAEKESKQFYVQGDGNPFVVLVRKSRFAELPELTLDSLLGEPGEEEQ